MAVEALIYRADVFAFEAWWTTGVRARSTASSPHCGAIPPELGADKVAVSAFSAAERLPRMIGAK
jgi:hypothetical protein